VSNTGYVLQDFKVIGKYDSPRLYKTSKTISSLGDLLSLLYETGTQNKNMGKIQHIISTFPKLYKSHMAFYPPDFPFFK